MVNQEVISRINRALSTLDLAKDALVAELTKLLEENTELRRMQNESKNTGGTPANIAQRVTKESAG